MGGHFRRSSSMKLGTYLSQRPGLNFNEADTSLTLTTLVGAVGVLGKRVRIEAA